MDRQRGDGMRQTEAARSSVENFKSNSPAFLNNVIPAPLSITATTGVALIDDGLTIEEAFVCNDQSRVAFADLIRDDSIFGIFFLAKAITFKFIAAVSFSARTADVEIGVIWNPFNTRTVLIAIDKLKVIG